MPAPPDTARLLAIAARIQAHADAARDEAARLARSAAGVHWHGAAAHAYRLHAGLLIARLRSAAQGLDDAAAALRRHAARSTQAVH